MAKAKPGKAAKPAAKKATRKAKGKSAAKTARRKPKGVATNLSDDEAREWLEPQPVPPAMDLEDNPEDSPLETIDPSAVAEPAEAPLPGPINPEREPAPIERPDETPSEEDEDEAPEPEPEPEQPEPDDEDQEGAPATGGESSARTGGMMEASEESDDGVGLVTMDEPAQAKPAADGTVLATRAAMPLSQEMPARGDLASGLSLPEQFLLVALRPGWDDRMTKARPGAQGAALVGSMLLELALRGSLKVQRNKFTVEDALELPPELAKLAADVRGLGEVSTQVAMERLTKGLSARLRPWVQSLERKGILREEQSRRLVVLKRSQLHLLNEGAKEKLENRLVRTLAGGGNPDARTIMLLGLVSASGLLREIVPASAYDFNRKRINALLSGRDTLAYRVDNSIRRVQDLALQTVLSDIRALQGTP